MNISKLLILLIISGCSLLEHRDYADEMDMYGFRDDTPLFKANEDFMVISGDTGRYSRNTSEILNRTPSGHSSSYEMNYYKSLEKERAFLETKLTDEEYYEYQKLRADLGGISEQIYYLRLSPRGKREYLEAKNINTRKVSRHPAQASGEQAVRRNRNISAYNPVFTPKNDVTLGMTMSEVQASWGKPERVDIAGDPKYRNQRWAFRKNGRIKYVYFEAGVVNGWSEE